MSGDVNRDAWAVVVQRLLDEQCKGNKSAFARRVIVDDRAINPRTVYAWLSGEMSATEKSVRAVAEGFGLNPIELLVEVGVYSPEQMMQIRRAEMDEERQAILDDPGFDNQQKEYILGELDRMEAEDEAAIEVLRQKDRRRRSERLQVLMEQQRSA